MDKARMIFRCGCTLREKGAEFERFIDVAGALLSRDYKGFPTYGMNGVVEVYKIEVDDEKTE